MWQVIRTHKYGLYGSILLNNVLHPGLGAIVAEVQTQYAKSTWKNRLPEIERSLNQFFLPVPGTRVPLLFVDRQAGVRLIKEGLEKGGATVTRKNQPGMGWNVGIARRADAVAQDTRLHLARLMLDVGVSQGQAHDGNALVRDGYDAEAARRAYAMERRAREAKGEPSADVVLDTGRRFSVHLPAHEAPVINDPHLHERIERAMVRHCTSIGVYRGWQTGYDLWCRGGEAYEMTMRSLYLGALAVGERHFGRLLIIRDKPTGSALTKPAALSEEFAPTFYDVYFNVERRAQDPTGWGLNDYERECFAGNEEALNAPVFYTLKLTPLTANTARYMFGKVVRNANIKCGERYAWTHLGRHERVERALDEIDRLTVEETVKKELRKRLVEYVGVKTGEVWLKTYGPFGETRRAATAALEFQTGRNAGVRRVAGRLPPPADTKATPAVLESVFRGRGRGHNRGSGRG